MLTNYLLFSFRLTINQVDILWSCLANDSDCADCLFHWLQGQAKGGAQHALSSMAISHIYHKKWPELKPENISMVALTLFQQLFILTLSDERRSSERSDVSGMDILWKVALRANETEVSMAAINYINTFYMEHQLKNEAEFVKQCMNYLTLAAEGLHNPDLQDNSIMCVQRALMLLNTHLETFRRRYAYHLRRWALEGKGINSHSALRTEGPGAPIKIILQPGGLSEKSYLHLYQTDLIGDLKAEIAKWYENLQGKSCSDSSSSLGMSSSNVLSDGPLRIITQGQEITSEYDERSLMDVGFKDNQIVYVSLGGRSRGRRNEDHPSLLPAPSKDCLPTILLLQTQYFEQLFVLMQTLGNMKLIKKGVNILQHTQAQVLSRRVWDILAMLPTNPTLLDTFKNLTFNQKTSMVEDDVVCIQELLDPSNLQKFMYCLHIVESLSKSRFTSSMKTSSHQRNQLKLKISKGKNAKKNSAIIKENVDESRNSQSQDERSVERGVRDQSQPNDQENNTENSSQREESSVDIKIKKSIEWSNKFIKNGGLEHLYNIFIAGVLQKNDDEYDEWRHDCLCSLLRILCLLGVEDLRQEENIIVIPKLNEDMLKLMDVRKTISRISSILNEAAVPPKDNQYKTGFWGRAQVVNFAMNILVCFAYSSEKAREILWSCEENYEWLEKLILDDPDPHVRRETCAALYRLCMGNSKTYSELIVPLTVLLISYLPMAEKMRTQTVCYSLNEDGKEPYGQASRDYFWLLSRLVDNTTPDLLKQNIKEVQNNLTIDVEALCHQVSKLIGNRDILERRHIQDDGLVGLLNLMANLVKYDPPFKYSQAGQQFIGKIFESLFALPTADNRDLPKCKSHGARAASYDLLIELTKNAPSNYMLLHKMLMLQHRPGPHSPYPWDYWPRDDGRSEIGYVGLANLGATCYMAACIQHIFMMPQARETILSVASDAPVKHKLTFCELQKMFAYLMESERKSYNPRSFCKVYQMDHQPLNTGEQKDMAEFFIDLVSKLEEMTPELKTLVKEIFCGVISNNVVSLDCGHVSRTLEEFYTVRCQVADMRNLQESLDEVTVKDTLEGDNMYTCSTCSKKVRAEKRACFKKLPQILCFNTMRYTFNMVTMLKEKVNTHFSFPMRLDMSRYVEKTLMPQQYQEEKLKSQSSQSDEGDKMESGDSEKTEEDIENQLFDLDENYEYDLVGVTVHTGTADGGHYYSFIKERDSDKKMSGDRWFLFNDAEVKLFDPSQIAAECFGGEMTVSRDVLQIIFDN
jgi:ubiquitin carboxyl-terminal hydrolase 34